MTVDRRRGRRIAAVLLLVVALAGLTGCQALGLAGPDRPTGTPTPSAAAPVASPVDCAALVTPHAVATLLGGDAPLAKTPADALMTPAGLGPYAVQASGGAWCRWGADPGGGGSATATPSPAPSRTLALLLLPRAAATWQRLTQQYPDSAAMGAHYDGGESRGGDCARATTGRGSSCHTNVLVGGSWAAVSGSSGDSVIDEKAFHDLVQSFLPALAAADARLPKQAPPAPLPCGGADWLRAVAGAFGPTSVTVLPPAGAFGMPSALLDGQAATVCAYRAAGDGSSGYLGTLSVLRDAADAYAAYHAAVVDHDPEASGGTIDHGGSQVATLVRYTDASGSTPAEVVVDVLVGDAWIQFAAPSGSADAPASVVQWVAGKL
ncbi:hypothetical protein [Leifsonia shinshuensis]|uniref:Uncharacterized protein n=1 Tax=Leifsonia shinshuensis TaxID=150026 RepID=A0A853CQR5_9MICO|nr:hypothetical protein [Leifsonia shinshuensis]NYJ23266.1 hypothetical protein [Leifsonia shinshuensis]